MNQHTRTELTAAGILKELRLGKKILFVALEKQICTNMRNRVATLKSEEDKLLSLLPVEEDSNSLFSTLNQSPEETPVWSLVLWIGDRKKPKSYQVSVVVDELEAAQPADSGESAKPSVSS